MKMDSHMLMLIWAILGCYYIHCDSEITVASMFEYTAASVIQKRKGGVSCDSVLSIYKSAIITSAYTRQEGFDCKLEIEASTYRFLGPNFHIFKNIFEVTIHSARISGFLEIHDGGLNGPLKYNLTKTNTVDQRFEKTTFNTAGNNLTLHMKKDYNDAGDFSYVIEAQIVEYYP